MIAWTAEACDALREAAQSIRRELYITVSSYCTPPRAAKRRDEDHPLEAYDVETIDDRHVYAGVKADLALLARIDDLIQRCLAKEVQST